MPEEARFVHTRLPWCGRLHESLRRPPRRLPDERHRPL